MDNIILTLGSMSMLSAAIHQSNVEAGWWTHHLTGESLLGNRLDDGRPIRNNGELMMLIVSELSEGSEGAVDGRMDDKLPHRVMYEVELADAAVRILDLGGARKVDFDGILRDLEEFEAFVNVDPAWMPDEALMSIVNCVSAAMEGDRKGSLDKRVPTRKAFDVGLTRALAAIFAVGEMENLNVMSALQEKWEFNKTRPDHQLENRRRAGGKVY